MNYKKELDKVMCQSEFVYKGVLVERLIGGWRLLGKEVKTPEEIDFVISEASEKLKDSVLDSPQPHGGTFNPSVR